MEVTKITTDSAQDIKEEEKTFKPEYLPVVTQLKQIYTDTNDSIHKLHERRYLDASKRFEELYDQKPKFFVRAPGKATILGEHIGKIPDYNQE